MTPTPCTATGATVLSPQSHALSRHVPDMARGFFILTSFGELKIEPGPTAERIADLVAAMLRAQLAAAERPTLTRDGLAYVLRTGAPLSEPVCNRCAFRSDPPACIAGQICQAETSSFWALANQGGAA